MIKINLITKSEAEQLAKLRDAHQFYLDNYDREYMRRIRLAKIDRALKIAQAVIETANEMLHSFRTMVCKSTESVESFTGSVKEYSIKEVADQVKDIERQSWPPVLTCHCTTPYLSRKDGKPFCIKCQKPYRP